MTDWTGGVATERATAVLANNPSMMTLEGTNTWILREPGAERSIVVDPGPLLDDHVQAVLAAAGPVGLTIVTHWHGDHTEASARFAELSGSVVRALDPDYCIDAEPLVDGEQINVDGLDITIVTTPGHTQDSISIYVPADRALLTGDTVLGHGTTVIAHPDGTLAPFLDSMGKMRALIDAE
ncbi:MAG: beta-lactamase, partial [Nocardioidaceae bacterium]|nr:beta-lactamase [Nocardioidaceae bacterium]